MGTICIFLGLIIFLCSIGLGCVAANYYLASPLLSTFAALPSEPLEVYLICAGVLGFIGLLICLNLVMHGMTYNKVQKIYKKLRNR